MTATRPARLTPALILCSSLARAQSTASFPTEPPPPATSTAEPSPAPAPEEATAPPEASDAPPAAPAAVAKAPPPRMEHLVTADEDAAEAEDAAKEANVTQRNIGLLLTLGFYSGLGGGFQAGTRDVGIRALFGFNPVLISIRRPPSVTSDPRFYSGYQISPDLYLNLLPARAGARVGLEAGYRYHSILKHGVAIGGFGSFGVGRIAECIVTGGLLVFPDGERELRRSDSSLSGNVEFSFPGPNLNFGASVALGLFP